MRKRKTHDGNDVGLGQPVRAIEITPNTEDIGVRTEKGEDAGTRPSNEPEVGPAISTDSSPITGLAVGYAVGDMIQVTSRASKFFPQIGVVHTIYGETLDCYLPKPGKPSVFKPQKEHVEVIGKAKIRWTKPLPSTGAV